MARDDGDILGSPQPREHKETEQEEDALIEESAPRTNSIFGATDQASLPHDQLLRLIELMSAELHLPSIEAIVSPNGDPSVPKIVLKMVSEACKIYISELTELARFEGKDYIEGDVILSRKYNLAPSSRRTGF
ncbi:unnamed protein product [Ectocarpus sp. 6 AP-2014]